MQDGITMLVAPLPGVRLIDGGQDLDKNESGSILGFRKDGDEVLFAYWSEDDKGMAWIPVSEFSPDPSAIAPPEALEDAPAEGEEPQERMSPHGPFGGGRSGVRRRSEQQE